MSKRAAAADSSSSAAADVSSDPKRHKSVTLVYDGAEGKHTFEMPNVFAEYEAMSMGELLTEMVKGSTKAELEFGDRLYNIALSPLLDRFGTSFFKPDPAPRDAFRFCLKTGMGEILTDRIGKRVHVGVMGESKRHTCLDFDAIVAAVELLAVEHGGFVPVQREGIVGFAFEMKGYEHYLEESWWDEGVKEIYLGTYDHKTKQSTDNPRYREAVERVKVRLYSIPEVNAAFAAAQAQNKTLHYSYRGHWPGRVSHSVIP